MKTLMCHIPCHIRTFWFEVSGDTADLSIDVWLLFFFLVSCWDSSLDCVQVHYQYFCGYRQVDSLT